MNFRDQIDFKSEYWKYTPRPRVPESFEASKETDPLDLVCLMGHTEDQLQSLTVGDLQDYIEVSSVKESEVFPVEHILKAKLDQVVENQRGELPCFQLNFVKNTPAPLWLPLNFKERLRVSIPKGLKQSLVFVDGATTYSAGESFVSVSCELQEESFLEVLVVALEKGSGIFDLSFSLSKSSEARFFGLSGGETNYKRFNVQAFQGGVDSSVTLNGLALGKGNSVVDFHSDSLHMNQNQKTNQLYKTLGRDEAHGIFGGRVHLTRDSKGAFVDQLNHNLLLGKASKVDTQPELNIDQEDVVATHGATTSSLDEEHFFYMSSRGFQRDQAEKFLIDAFCRDPFSSISEPGLRDYVMGEIERGLDQ